MKLNNYLHKQKGLEMYFSLEVAQQFAQLEQNEKNFRVAAIIDTVICQEFLHIPNSIYCAELGGGAHPDRYEEFFRRLIHENGHIDWVDISEVMLDLAKKYISDEKYTDRNKVITFVNSDIFEYLRELENEKLDLALMKYTIDHIEDLNELFQLLSIKLKKGGKLISTIASTSPELKSYSTNARFLYNGEQFPDNETRTLQDGDNFSVKFFQVPGDPLSGCLPGAQILKYYHSSDKIKRLADFYDFDIFLGDWKERVLEENQKSETMNQEILILTKR